MFVCGLNGGSIMELMASGLSPQMVWAFCKAVWQNLLCHWSRPSTPCSLGFEWEWINQMVWERSANLMHFVSRSAVIWNLSPLLPGLPASEHIHAWTVTWLNQISKGTFIMPQKLNCLCPFFPQETFYNIAWVAISSFLWVLIRC